MRWKNEGTRRPKLHLCKNRLVVVVAVGKAAKASKVV